MQLVINWHILENCNYGCGYCFAKYADNDQRDELYHRPADWRGVIDAMADLPGIIGGAWDGVRLNIAGGEPLLLWRAGRGPLAAVLDHAHDRGLKLSLITNGSLVTDDFIARMGPRLQLVGVSLDAADAATNQAIGRHDSKGRTTSATRVAEIFTRLREVNPGIECKLNTVVCAANAGADLDALVATVKPHRWKVFQMLPVAVNSAQRASQQRLAVNDAQFQGFCARHADRRAIMRDEDNATMAQSYLILDPLGRLVKERPDPVNGKLTHHYSEPVHAVGFARALAQIDHDIGKFRARNAQALLAA